MAFKTEENDDGKNVSSLLQVRMNKEGRTRRTMECMVKRNHSRTESSA